MLDLFLCEGDCVIPRLFLGLLQYSEAEILATALQGTWRVRVFVGHAVSPIGGSQATGAKKPTVSGRSLSNGKADKQRERCLREMRQSGWVRWTIWWKSG